MYHHLPNKMMISKSNSWNGPNLGKRQTMQRKAVVGHVLSRGRSRSWSHHGDGVSATSGDELLLLRVRGGSRRRSHHDDGVSAPVGMSCCCWGYAAGAGGGAIMVMGSVPPVGMNCCCWEYSSMGRSFGAIAVSLQRKGNMKQNGSGSHPLISPVAVGTGRSFRPILGAAVAADFMLSESRSCWDEAEAVIKKKNLRRTLFVAIVKCYLLSMSHILIYGGLYIKGGRGVLVPESMLVIVMQLVCSF